MKTSCAVMCAVLSGLAVAAEPAQKLHFSQIGFTIETLEAGGHAGPQVLSMFLPAEDGFAANVSVQIQQYKGTIEEYAALSGKQFEAASMKIKAEKMVKGEWVCEYTGRLGERDMHWYAKAVKQNDRVFLVTAAAADATWPQLGPKLKGCVDSFAIDKAKDVRRTDARHNRFMRLAEQGVGADSR